MIRLSKKFIRRSITGLALLAPIVYLFGSQFFALNGAHGQEVFAEPVYVDTWVAVDSLPNTGVQQRLVVDSAPSVNTPSWPTSINSLSFTYTFNGRDCNKFNYGRYQSYYFLAYGFNNVVDFYYFYPSGPTESFVIPLNWEFDSTFFPQAFVNLFVGISKYYVLESVPSEVVPENNSAYTEYIFGNMFGQSNFLTEWGTDAISDNPHGFAPFGNMLQFVDENMLHLSDLQIGLMGYGYFYYCAHVLLFVCFFDLTMFFLGWILRIAHKFGGDEYED